eukprot:CAMPEP_0172175492 /NCGR_PEP_ID=MMETSP1050-20130122/14261_1 /TAXON_ID=233186 /ORGANISM="Cryptomonas curvata, Strain CCAP979/52" /LENGTH=70 /DNA_ID=CAMNT_0012847607 /DNA_START=20 /DNA_END=229 /DNA_ORIENTATION=-
MKVARLFKLFMVPGENVENPGGLENKNPMDDLNTDLQAWGGRIPNLPEWAPDYEAFAETCPSEGPKGGEW